MFKRTILWIVPLLFMALIAAYFILTPLIAMHASNWQGQ